MPRTQFKSENRSESPFDFPKVKLSRNERARLIAIDKEPLMEFVHTLKAPQIVNGRPVMEANADGVPKAKEDFLGRYICLGDPAVLSDKGKAVDVCPVCASAAETDAVDFPQRRFGMHVIQYTNLKPNSWEVAQWGVTLRVWLFGDRTFNQLISFAEDVGDIRKHDLLLGPCENEMYQKFDIRPSTQQGIWLRKDEWKAEVVKLYREGQTPHLEELIGRRGQETLREDLGRVLLRYKQAYGGEISAEDQSEAALDAESLLSGDVLPVDDGGVDADALLGDGDATPAAEPVAAETGLDDDLLSDGDAAPSEAPAATSESSTNDDKASFDDLLNELPTA